MKTERGEARRKTNLPRGGKVYTKSCGDLGTRKAMPGSRTARAERGRRGNGPSNICDKEV